MRLKLANQFALLLGLSALVIALAVGGLLFWNLRAGFSAYLNAQDEGFIRHFAQVASRIVARDGVDALAGPPQKMQAILRAMRRPDEFIPRSEANLKAMPPREEGSRPSGSFDLGPHGSRISVLTPDGKLLSGRPTHPRAGAFTSPIVVKGETVAIAMIHAGHASNEAVDAEFLGRLYRGLGLALLAALVVAVAASVYVSRRWTRALTDAQAAARRIATGEFDVRLKAAGQDELGLLIEDINSMADSLQSLESSRKRWIAELSHELRTPLAVLRAEIEALQDGVRIGDPAALSSLQQEVTRLTRLADDFHQLATSDLHALPIQREDVDPRALAARAIERMQSLVRERGLTLSLHDMMPANEAMKLIARWDRDRIMQLFDNVLQNSVRYTDAPGRIDVVLALESESERVRITIDDTPPGVPQADLAQLFDPLFRVDISRSRDLGGSGLGLAICRAIVELHGGSIDAQPSPLGGLRVEIRLPLDGGGA